MEHYLNQKFLKSYCVKERKETECKPNSERYERAKNGRLMLKCTCANCGITKCRFVRDGTVQEAQGGSIGDALLSAGLKGLYEMGKVGTKNLLKSDTAKKAAASYIKKHVRKNY